MIQCGELCGTCLSKCNKDYDQGLAYMQCVRCEGMDPNCEGCGGDGYMEIRECPVAYVGKEMIDAANLASMCKRGPYPVAGGLLDQSAWFIAFVQRLQSETNTIEADRMKQDG